MKGFRYVILTALFLTGCTANQNYHADVENQARDIVEKVQYDERKFNALEQNTRPPLEIRDETINIVQSVIAQDNRVKEARIDSDSNNVYISILVDEDIAKAELIEIGARAAQDLSSFAEGGRPIRKGELGELYDFYNLTIMIGENKKVPIMRGIKSPAEPAINWEM